MIELPVECPYLNDCADRSSTKCKKCKNNRLRNREVHFFEPANDNPIPNPNPRVTFSGPAEQTKGYKCPVCGDFTNPYQIKDNRCGHCGFKLNTY